MILGNRFITIADRFRGQVLDLALVFHDARASEAESVIEALYVISDRRWDQGKPIQLGEIAGALGSLLENRDIREVAVEICVDGLLAGGLSKEYACRELEKQADATRQSNPAGPPRMDRSDQLLIGSVDQIHSGRFRLPSSFGDIGPDGKQRYELRRLLGGGAQGTVYEAVDRVFEDHQTPAFVAMKILHEPRKHPGGLAEGNCARRIRNRYVARVLDRGVTSAGESYIAYELIDGMPMDDWLRRYESSLSVAQRCRIICCVGRGVQSAHAAGVIHRDLKPSNILINREQEPVVTDFGIACLDSDPTLQAHYGTRGSLAFMAPEQFDGSSGGVMPSMDVYAIGGVLLWLLTGRFPNGDRVADAIGWLERREGGGPARLSGSGIDNRLMQIIMRALEVDPADRYQSAESLASDLELYLANRPIAWIDRRPWRRMVLFTRRNPGVVALYMVVVMLFGGLIGFGVHYQSRLDLERSKSAHAAQVQELTHQVAIEQERVEQIKERTLVARAMIEAWAEAIRSEKPSDHTTANLMFLYTVSTRGLLKDDPQFADKLLNHRVRVAEDYLASLDPDTTSPLHRALWHQLIASWSGEIDPDLRLKHLREARNLVREFAPSDKAWLSELDSNEAMIADTTTQE